MKEVESVEFGTPPPRRDRGRAARLGSQLRANPGQPGVIRRYTRDEQKIAHAYANHARSGRISAFRGCDVWAVTVDDAVEVWGVFDGAASH